MILNTSIAPSPTLFGVPTTPQQFFIPGDCHEGPVWVPNQQRLYTATTKKLNEDSSRVGINFLDLSGVASWDNAENFAAVSPTEWVHDSNMANSMYLHNEGQHILIAEQGTHGTPSRIVMRDLDNSEDVTVLADSYEGKPFNSINKVIQSRLHNHIIFSDPDYGHKQGFRWEPQLVPSIYVLNGKTGKLSSFTCGLKIPHGLTLSSDERTLFVTDTSASHEDMDSRRTVFKLNFDPVDGEITSICPECCFEVDEGMPDGSCNTEKYLWVCGGDGIYCADGKSGDLLGKIPSDLECLNICPFGDEKEHAFVTQDYGVKIYMNMKGFVVAK